MNVDYRKYLTQPLATDLGYTLLRILTGCLLVYHGTSKIFEGLGVFIENIRARGWPFPELQGFLAAYTEFAGGVLLIVGLFTRPVAIVNIVMFTIITYGWHTVDPFAKQEKALLFLAISVFIALMGPGKWSVDARLFSRTGALPRD